MVSSTQSDLFSASPQYPEGLRYAESFLSQAEETALVARMPELAFAPFQFHGFEGRRRVASFGWEYDFAASRAVPAPPAPGWLSPLRDRAAAWVGAPSQAIQQIGIIEYEPGAPIGWHRDRPLYADVIGVSLLSRRALRLRRRVGARWERATLPLSPRSVYLLRGAVRDQWEHSLPAGDELRYAIMLRTLRRSHPGVPGESIREA